MMANDAIPVPLQLRRPHRLVAATRDAATGLRPGDDGRLRVGPRPGVFHVVVSRPLLRRALRLIQAICAESGGRGWEVQTHRDARHSERPGAAVVIRRQAYPVKVHEQTDSLPFTEGEIEKWRERRWPGDRRDTPPLQLRRKQANGRLMLFLPGGARGSRSRWTDGPRGLIEDKLASVFPALEARAEADERRAEELARERAESEQRQERARVERGRVERLKDEAEVWHQAELARGYVTALRARVAVLDGEERERIAAWCDWIEAWADRADPTTDTTQIVGLDRDQFKVLGGWDNGRGFRRSF